MEEKRYVVYYRVSTQKQGNSGLGLDAQRTIVDTYLKDYKPLAEFTDIESGTKKGNNREGLKQAIIEAKKSKATLVIAKLDRLSRNVSFITTLMESGIEFIACDMPTANKFSIHIFAALAEQEAEMISIRTKQALQELKNKGVKLGKPENLTATAIKKGLEKRQLNANENEDNSKAGAFIISLKKQGQSFGQIAEELNRLKYNTRRGSQFHPIQVKRLYERFA